MYNEKEFDFIYELSKKHDLLDYNERTHDIEVNKFGLDMDFEEGKIVYIHFDHDREDIVREYEMVSEDYWGIVMSYVCEYED